MGSDPLCVEEATPYSSGVGDSACLVSPGGRVFLTDYYDYAEDMRGDGWNAYGLEVADAPGEHHHSETDTEPEACRVAWTLMGDASDACDSTTAEPEVDTSCVSDFGFGDKLVELLPRCVNEPAP